MFEICVFTAGEQGYADTVLDFIDQEGQIIRHRLYRQHCVQAAPGVYVKDLRIIQDRDLKDIVIVDNSIVSFAFQLANGIPISSFTDQRNDEELLFMVTLLEEIYAMDDFRPHLEQRFGLCKLMQEHGQVQNKRKGDQKLLQNAISSQQQNNYTDLSDKKKDE